MIHHALLGRICHVLLIMKLVMQVVITREHIACRGVKDVNGRKQELSKNVEKQLVTQDFFSNE